MARNIEESTWRRKDWWNEFWIRLENFPSRIKCKINEWRTVKRDLFVKYIVLTHFVQIEMFLDVADVPHFHQIHRLNLLISFANDWYMWILLYLRIAIFHEILYFSSCFSFFITPIIYMSYGGPCSYFMLQTFGSGSLDLQFCI